MQQDTTVASTDEQAPPTRRPRRRRVVRALVASGLVVVVATGGATWWALDRFVIPHVEVADVVAAEEAAGTSDTDSTEWVVDGWTATSDAGEIAVTQVVTGEGDDQVTYYVADVQLADATDLRSAFANDQFGENVIDEPSDIAADNDAILAINGDYYGFRDTGIVVRNGVAYRDGGAREGLALYDDGSAAVYDETTTSADELIADGVWNTLSFGPAIVEDGAIVDGIDEAEVDTNVGNHSIQGEQPRTAIGIVDDGHYVLVVVDGRDDGYSRGVTLTELAEIMQSLGVETAYNLDGGGSSTMVFDGQVVNQPSNGGERGTSDILYVGGAS